MESSVKLTLRIPLALHARLRKRAISSNRSLNSIIIDTIRENLEQTLSEPVSEYGQALRLLREHGLIEDLDPRWGKYILEAPDISHAELRERLKGVLPLSEIIIEERGPQE